MILMCMQRHIHISPTVMNVSNVGLALNEKWLMKQTEQYPMFVVTMVDGARKKKMKSKFVIPGKLLQTNIIFIMQNFKEWQGIFDFFFVTIFSFFDFLKLQIRLTFGHTVYIDELVFILLIVSITSLHFWMCGTCYNCI